MPQHPVARPYTPTGPYPNPPVPSPRPPFPPPSGGSPAGPGPAEPAMEAASQPAGGLTLNKILAGAGAAATTALLGSFFGAAGTVAGAALGSMASTVATTIYQRSLDRTQKTLVARIRPVGARSAAAGPEEATVQLRVEPAVPSAPPRRRWAMWAGATVLVFVLGLLAVTGVEWIKGSTITSGDSGTSVGRVLGRDAGVTTPTSDPSSTSQTSDESTADPSSSADPSVTPSSTADPDANSSRSTRPTGTGSTGTTNAPGLGGPVPGHTAG